jgi:hypothetical protein
MGEVFQTIPLDKVNDVTMVSQFGVTLIAFDTYKGGFNVFADQKSANNILAQINKIVFAPKTTTAPPTSSVGVADEIRQLKSLLDDGILTQDEFDAKKKQLLGL